MSMQARWQSATNWYQQRSSRERALMLLVAIAVSGWLLYALLVAPAVQSLSLYNQTSDRQQAEQQRLDYEISQLQAQLSVDLNQPLRERETHLLARQQRLQAQLAQRAQLMPRDESVRWVQALLELPAELELRSFDTLPAVALLDSDQTSNQNSSQTSTANLWQHPVEVRIYGQYHGLRDYIEQLDAIPQPFYWQHLSYEVEQYPQAVLTLRVYALSTEKELLGG